MAFKIRDTAAKKSEPDTEFWLEKDVYGDIVVKAKRGSKVKSLTAYRPSGVSFFTGADGVGIATDPDNDNRVCVIE